MEEEVVLDGAKGRAGMRLEGNLEASCVPLGSFAHRPPLKKEPPLDIGPY